MYRTYKLHVMKRRQAWSRWITILSICFVCSSAVAESDFSMLLDSLRNKIQESQGKDKIEVLSLLARLDSRSRDYDKWEKECRLQNDAVALSFAYAERANCLNNMYPDTDSVLVFARRVMPEIQNEQTCIAYYIISSVVVNHLIYTGNIKEAQIQVNAMLRDAHESHNALAQAVAYYSQGRILYSLRQYKDAIDAFQKGLNLCPPYKHQSAVVLLSVYGEIKSWLIDSYIQIGRYKEADEACSSLNELLNFMVQNGHKDLIGRLPIRSLSLQAISYIRQGKIDEAERLIRKCDELMLPEISMRWYSDFYKARSELSTSKKQYLDAIADLEVCMQNTLKYTPEYYFFLKKKAELLPYIGRGQDGIKLLVHYIDASDSIERKDIARQAHEIRTEYKVDDLSAENNRVIWMLVICAVMCVILIILIIMYVFHNRRLRSKNRKLVENLHKLDQMGGVKAFYEWSVDEKTEHDGTEIIAEEERELYGKIVSYLSAENRFAETQISWDTLASALGTNRTYIANAIKKCTGLAVNEYVNMLRLEYARGLLVERPEDSITLISEEAGFGSVRNFNRLFVAKYAVSPTEYRNNN